jgi:hypothetical protein
MPEVVAAVERWEVAVAVEAWLVQVVALVWYKEAAFCGAATPPEGM